MHNWLGLKSKRERIAEVALNKRGTGAVHSFSGANHSQKTSELLEKTMSKFPTLNLSHDC